MPSKFTIVVIVSAIAVAAIALLFFRGTRRPHTPEISPESVGSLVKTGSAHATQKKFSESEGISATIKVPAEWMLSRTSSASSHPVNAPHMSALASETNIAAEEINEPGARSKNALARVLQLYAQPMTMISPVDISPAMESGMETPGDKIKQLAKSEKIAEQIAFSYINKVSMLSQLPDDFSEAWVAYAKKEEVPESLVPDSRLPADRTPEVKKGVDPDAVARAMYYTRDAEAKLSAGLTDQALAAYAQALVVYPQMSYANKQMGRLSLMRREYDKAVQYLTAALNADDGLSETLNDLGIAYLYSGRNKEALLSFAASLESEPGSREPLFNTGLALRRLNRVDESRQTFEHYLENEPQDARAYRELAMIDLMETNRVAALQKLERAKLLDNRWYTPWLDAALIYADMKDVVNALDQLDRALVLAPPMAVFQVYNQPAFHNIRLLPDSKPFESRLAAKARKLR